MAKNNNGAAGTVVALAAIAAAGAYFLYGSKDAVKNRNKIKGWAVKAKGEALEKLEKITDLNETAYHDVIDAVTKKYKAVKGIDPKELTSLVSELKGHWKNISKELKMSSDQIAKTAKKTTKKVKKVVKG